MMRRTIPLLSSLAALVLMGSPGQAQEEQAAEEATEQATQAPEQAELIASAESAAPDHISKDATIYDLEMQPVREGTNGWWCMPDNPGTPGNDPMCGDANTMEWLMALVEGTEPPEGKLGFSYMIAGGSTASNLAPAAEPPEGAEWLEDGPHMMIVGVPEEVRRIPSDPVPDTSTTYVMWGGTPYAHLMVPYTEATQ